MRIVLVKRGLRSVTLKSVFLGTGFLTLLLCLYMAYFGGLSTEIVLGVFLVNALNMIFTHLAFATNNNFLKIYAFFFLVWYIFRLPILIVSPESHFYINHPLTSFTHHDLEYALYVLLFYHGITGFVISTLGSISRPITLVQSGEGHELSKFFNVLLSWFVILSAYKLVHDLVLQLGRDFYDPGGGVTGYLNLLFASDLVVLLLWIVILQNYKGFDASAKIKVWAFVWFYAFILLIGGSRGFMVRVLAFWVIFFLVKYKNMEIGVNFRNALLATVLASFMLATIYIGHAYRSIYRNPEAEFSFAAIYDAASNHPWLWWDWFNWASSRASHFDLFSMVVLRADMRYSHMISLSNSFKVLANWIVPGGDVFTYGAHRMLPTHEGAISFDYAQIEVTSSHNDEIGLFPLAIAYFGTYSGMIFVLAVIFLMMLLFSVGVKIVPGRYKLYWYIWGYWMFYGAVGPMMQGLDVFIFGLVIFFLQLVMLIAFDKFLSVCGEAARGVRVRVVVADRLQLK